MSLFQQTSLTFGAAKTLVAQQNARQTTTEFLTRAGQSIQQAVKYWNRFNWKWRLKQAPVYTIAANDTSITLPYDFKDVYTVRWTGVGPHYLRSVNAREYDRQWYDQSIPGFTMAYELFKEGELGKLGLVPASSRAGTIVLKYYSRMTVPCTFSVGPYSVDIGTSSILGDLTGATLGARLYTSTAGLWADGAYISSITPALGDTTARMRLNFSASATATGAAITYVFGGDDELLDIPEDYENGILSWAQAHFLSATGAPRERIQYFMGLALDELNEARRVNEPGEDQDMAFQSIDEMPLHLINPNATTL
jgi:hypothetical protein